jgi:prepilin-type N-terminal cleavage/methylation domain-containing protein
MSFRPQGMAMRSPPPKTLRSPPPKTLRQRFVRRGFTLVELLIAMALTLILVYAVARFFSFVGETVRDGRAQTEMGGQLRAAFLRLQQDFSEMTVRVGGRVDAGQALGCLELWDGIASDNDPNGDGLVNANGISDESFRDPNSDSKPDGLMLGDCDDIVVMTVRSEGEPYVGRMCQQVPGSNPPQFMYSTIRSNLAEVIWFTTFKDLNISGDWQIDEPRYLVRRQLLIRPDLTGQLTSPGSQSSNPTDFFLHNDISVHLSAGPTFTPIANSLADLSQRENRCVHQNLDSANLGQNGLTAALGYMPNPMMLNVGTTVSCNAYSLDGLLQFIGEDKMLSNVIGFDVRVYDPYAVLRADNADMTGTTATTDDDAQGVLSPGDAGYAYAVANNFPSYLTNPSIGVGAYVDLWYNREYRLFPAAQRNLLLQNSAYSWAPNGRSFAFNGTNVNYPMGASWDTWTMAYEKDGLPQVPPGYAARPVPNTDWMVDGLDNDGNAGVDDPDEAETAPPYPSVWVGSNARDDNFDGTVDDSTEQNYSRMIPTTLRGIEVRIRMYEPGTRQTRQATVHTDFIPE